MFSNGRVLEFITADVFTDQVFGGNQLAIIPDGRYLTDGQMQHIAREFNFSETIFILPPSVPEYVADIRIFTPSSELPFAGHPLVGAGWFLGHTLPAVKNKTTFAIGVPAGRVDLEMIIENQQITGAWLAAPRAWQAVPHGAAAEMAACLKLDVGDIRTDIHPPLIAGCGGDFGVVQIASRGALARARPDTASFEAFLPRDRAVGLYLYTTDDTGACDTEARMFAPLEGLPEDPATGSATVAFIGAYAQYHRPDRQIGLVRQKIRQGLHMGRPSILQAEAEKYHGDIVKTRVGGTVRGVTKGVMYLP